MKAIAIKRCQTLDLHLNLVQLGEPPEVYRYPTTVGDYSATSMN